MRVVAIVLGLAACLTFGLLAGTAQANEIGIERVRQMAFDHGIVRLEEIELRRRKGIWKVEGEDASGNDIEMDVDARTGRIIRMERD